MRRRAGIATVWALCTLGGACSGVDVGQLAGTYHGSLERKTCAAEHESVPATVTIDGTSAPGGTTSQPLFAVLFTLPQDVPPTTCALPASTTSATAGNLVPGYTCPAAFDVHFMTASPLSTGDNGAQGGTLVKTASGLDVVLAPSPVCCGTGCATGSATEWVEFDGGL
jgi:hypothetical protein